MLTKQKEKRCCPIMTEIYIDFDWHEFVFSNFSFFTEIDSNTKWEELVLRLRLGFDWIRGGSERESVWETKWRCGQSYNEWIISIFKNFRLGRMAMANDIRIKNRLASQIPLNKVLVFFYFYLKKSKIWKRLILKIEERREE